MNNCNCDGSTPRCFPAFPVPDFRSIFGQTLQLLSEARRSNLTDFDLTSTSTIEDCVACYWRLNVTDLNANICSRNFTGSTNFCLTTTTRVTTPTPSVYTSTSIFQSFTPVVGTGSASSSGPDIARPVQHASSNSNLLPLIVLLIVPILLVGACFLYVCFKKRKDDEERNALNLSTSAPQTPVIGTSKDPGHDNLCYLDDSQSDLGLSLERAYTDDLAELDAAYQTRRKLQTNWAQRLDSKFDKVFEGLAGVEAASSWPSGDRKTKSAYERSQSCEDRGPTGSAGNLEITSGTSTVPRRLFPAADLGAKRNKDDAVSISGNFWGEDPVGSSKIDVRQNPSDTSRDQVPAYSSAVSMDQYANPSVKSNNEPRNKLVAKASSNLMKFPSLEKK